MSKGSIKRCTKCFTWYDATTEYFSPDNRATDGLQSGCRVCKRDSDRKSYQKHRETRLEQQQYYGRSKNGKTIRKRYANSIIGILRQTYYNLKQRCNNSKTVGYKNYGGRGIQNKFKSSDNFVDYIINKLRADPRGLQIDRINNNGHYEPGNIRFVTRSENNLNRRDSKIG